MNEREYRAHPAISRSQLWALKESPEKFRFLADHPPEPTQALIFGQLVHKLLLEPHTFTEDFAIAPEVDRRTKVGKAELDSFQELLGQRTAVSRTDYKKASNMVKKAIETPFVQELLDGNREQPFFWKDSITREFCKIRVDCITQTAIVDYKTTSSAENKNFVVSAIKYGYDFQAAMYCEGVRRVTNRELDFIFIVQEKTAPYSVNIFKADKHFMKHGYETFRELLELYHDCMISDNWYGYLGAKPTITTLSLPEWIQKGKQNGAK